MTASISLRNLTLDYPVYSVKAKSLRSALASVAVGGSLMKNKSDMAVVRSISNLNLEIKEGDRLGIVGHNGSGKTSLLKVLAGVYEPSSGFVEIHGRISSMISMSIGLDMEASGLQNIKNLAMMQMVPAKEIQRRLPSIIEFSELGRFIDMPFKTYSAGMMARLTFAVATEIASDIILLDEWIGAGDAAFQSKAAARMTGFVDSAKIVVLATHSPVLVQQVCNKVLAMDTGRATFFGTTKEWAARNAQT